MEYGKIFKLIDRKSHKYKSTLDIKEQTKIHLMTTPQ